MTDLQFKIDQLRKDKIIYATEACAASITALLVVIISEKYFPKGLEQTVDTVATLFAVGYWLYAGFGNLARLSKIKELEKELWNKRP